MSVGVYAREGGLGGVSAAIPGEGGDGSVRVYDAGREAVMLLDDGDLGLWGAYF